MYNVFVYGSLLNSQSASHLLGICAEKVGFRAAKLENWRHVFDVQETVIVAGQRAEVAFLNIEEHTGSALFGQLISLSSAQLENLKKRERQYDLIKVTPYDIVSDEMVIAYTVCGFKKNAELPILQEYIYKVERGAMEHGALFADEFLAHMRQHIKGRSILKGSYQFVSKEQNILSGVKT